MWPRAAWPGLPTWPPAALKSIGADAVLMGEVLMRAKDKGAMLAALREASK